VRFAEITHNPFYDNRQTFNLAEVGGKNDSRKPTSSTIANNVLISSKGRLITDGEIPAAMTDGRNMVFGAMGAFRLVDLGASIRV